MTLNARSGNVKRVALMAPRFEACASASVVSPVRFTILAAKLLYPLSPAVAVPISAPVAPPVGWSAVPGAALALS